MNEWMTVLKKCVHEFEHTEITYLGLYVIRYYESFFPFQTLIELNV